MCAGDARTQGSTGGAGAERPQTHQLRPGLLAEQKLGVLGEGGGLGLPRVSLAGLQDLGLGDPPAGCWLQGHQSGDLDPSWSASQGDEESWDVCGGARLECRCRVEISSSWKQTTHGQGQAAGRPRGRQGGALRASSAQGPWVSGQLTEVEPGSASAGALWKSAYASLGPSSSSSSYSVW